MSEARAVCGKSLFFSAVSAQSDANFYSALIFWFFFIKEKDHHIIQWPAENSVKRQCGKRQT
jgi:hypothetical protein